MSQTSRCKVSAVLAGAVIMAVAGCVRAGPAGTPSASGGRILTLPLGDGLVQRALYQSPARPRALLVMLPGGAGDIGLEGGGGGEDEAGGDDLLVRARADWVARGYAVLIPDTIDGADLHGARSSSPYGQVVDGLAAYGRRLAGGVPVFLVGHSQGTVAAMNGAAQAPAGLLSGVVLIESVSVPGRRSTETVFDADPAAVRAPALVVANREDGCDVTPPAMAPAIARAMSASAGVTVLTTDSDGSRSDRACGALSAHGDYGAEGALASAVSTWLRAHGG